jgi:hypothetical protein
MRKTLALLTLCLVVSSAFGAWDIYGTNAYVKNRLRVEASLVNYCYLYSATNVGAGYIMSWKTDSIIIKNVGTRQQDSVVWRTFPSVDSVKWGPVHDVIVQNYKGSTDWDSVVLSGKDSSGNAQKETLAFAANDTYKLSTKSWRAVNVSYTKSASNNDDTIQVYGYPRNTVKICATANDPAFAGILADSTVAYALGPVIWAGKAFVYMTNTTVRGRNGTAVITTTTAGNGKASVTGGALNFGVLLQPLEDNETAKRRWCWIHPSQI